MMKKLILVLVVLFSVATLSAQSPDLSALPKGKWLDANWNAVWEIGADSIRILDTNGSVLYDFKDKIKDLKINPGLTEVSFSFRCDEAERNYVFRKATTNLAMDMEIDPDWSTTNYKVTMDFQR